MNTANQLATIAKQNAKKVQKEKDPYKAFEKKIRWESHQYVRFVIKRCKELALQGYGSVEITIDQTTDMFQMDEGRNSCYSSRFVVTLLGQEGFKFQEDSIDDHYDAFSAILVWNAELPTAPKTNRIGMSWE